MKYEQWLNEWLDNYVRLTAKTKTIERYCQIINKHIVPKLGNLELEELSTIIIQKFVTELTQSGNIRTGKGLSSNSVNSIITVIRNSTATACSTGLLKTDFADKIKRPKRVEKQIECFSLTEQKQIEGAALIRAKPHRIGIVISLYTGLRLGEILALQWKDVDFSKGVLTIDKSCHDGINEEGKFKRITEPPKTASSKRIIPIPKQLVPLLREYKKLSRSDYIVSNGEKIFAVRTYQRNFEAILKKLKIKHRGFHALRHTFATRALECGMDVKTLSEILGHKSPTITLNRYVHSMLNHKKDMMNKLGKLF